MIVRDPMIAEPLLPRFLAPGDEARMAVLMQNLDLPAGEGVAQSRSKGRWRSDGRAAPQPPRWRRARRWCARRRCRRPAPGRGVIHLAVTGPGGFTVQRETAILVRPARPAMTLPPAASSRPARSCG